MSPQVVAAARNVLVVRWHQRGRNAAGDTIDTPVLSFYRIEDGRLRHAEMFYFDLPAVHLFLDLSAQRRSAAHVVSVVAAVVMGLRAVAGLGAIAWRG